MREGKSDARSFYEIECTQMQWSVRHQGETGTSVPPVHSDSKNDGRVYVQLTTDFPPCF